MPDHPVPHRGLGAHLVSCFAGAAIDNVFRLVSFLMLAATMTAGLDKTLDGAAIETANTRATLWAMLAFMLPSVALAPLAGAVGDRLRKHLLMRWVRVADLAVIAVGVAGMAFGSSVLMLGSLVLLGAASAIFGAVKYSSLPEVVTPANLPTGNAWLQATTIVAVLFGIGLGGLADGAVGPFGLPPWLFVAVVSGSLAIIGLIGAWNVPPLPAADPTARIRPFDFAGQLRVLGSAPGLLTPTLSLAGFWAFAALANTMVGSLAKTAWGLDGSGIAALQLSLAIGMIVGAALTTRFIVRQFPAGLPVVGALITGVVMLIAAWIGHAALATPTVVTSLTSAPAALMQFALLLVVVGAAAGAWEVAIQILIQERAPEQVRTRVFAAVGVSTSFGILAVTVFSIIARELLHLTSADLLTIAGGSALAVALGAAWLFRVQVVGWFSMLVVRTLWDIRIEGGLNLPATGGCVVVCNHLSYADGLILAAALPRRANFLVYRKYVEMPVVGLFLRAGGCIPVSSEDARRAKLAALVAATEAAKEGRVVVIFAEGKLTRSGQLDSFKAGFERVAKGAGVPIIPAFLHGLWDSPFSRNPRRQGPRLRRRVDLSLGPALPAETSAAEVRVAVTALGFEQAQRRAERSDATLGRLFLAQSRWKPGRTAVMDAQGRLANWQLGGIAQALVPHLGLADDERAVGVLLPPGRAGTIMNLALALAGRTAVNLNHTVSPAQLQRMCELAGLRTVITANAYLKRIGEPAIAPRLVKAEELLPKVSKWSVLASAALNLLLPAPLRCQAQPEDVAVIVFSSGTTGDPKGIQLTHAQLVAQCRAIAEGLDLHTSDAICSPLPLFHSFGLVPGMWMGLAIGLPVAGQPDPNDGVALAKLRHASGATLVLTTATFARMWLRRADPALLKGLRWAVAGAERCPEELKKQWEDAVGCPLLEGYGCTELAPTVSLNLPTVTVDGETEVRSRVGSVGRALPGLQVLAVDPESHAPLPAGSEGMLIVRSPARMLGYLGRDDLTGKAFVTGGYATGDIGKVDGDGFIHITGRLSRFAKIAGEMVPLDTVETALMAAVGAEPEIAVVGVPDPTRGERLLVLVVGDPALVAPALEKLEALAALWRPKARDVRQVAELPRLGTGKRDLKKLKELAVEVERSVDAHIVVEQR